MLVSTLCLKEKKNRKTLFTVLVTCFVLEHCYEVIKKTSIWEIPYKANFVSQAVLLSRALFRIYINTVGSQRFAIGYS